MNNKDKCQLNDPITPPLNLKGQLLIATPAMEDPRFYKALIFICAHDAHGAMGLVLNNILPGVSFEDMIAHFDLQSAHPHATSTVPVLGGGPVETGRGFVLHTAGYHQADTIPINDDYAVTGTIEVLKEIATGKGPQPMLFMLGYAGWTAGQLDRELQDNVWLTVPPDNALLFEVPAERKWLMAMSKLGISPEHFSIRSGNA